MRTWSIHIYTSSALQQAIGSIWHLRMYTVRVVIMSKMKEISLLDSLWSVRLSFSFTYSTSGCLLTLLKCLRYFWIFFVVVNKDNENFSCRGQIERSELMRGVITTGVYRVFFSVQRTLSRVISKEWIKENFGCWWKLYVQDQFLFQISLKYFIPWCLFDGFIYKIIHKYQWCYVVFNLMFFFPPFLG